MSCLFNYIQYFSKNQKIKRSFRIDINKCYCYNELAEQIGNSGIEVGRQVTITGKLMPDNYIDKNGTKRYGFKVLVKAIEKGARPKSARQKAQTRPDISVKVAA